MYIKNQYMQKGKNRIFIWLIWYKLSYNIQFIWYKIQLQLDTITCNICEYITFL